MATAEQTERLLGSSDLASLFGWSVSGIKKLDRLGVLPKARRVAGRRVWNSEELPLIEERLEARRDGRRQESGKAA